MGACLGTNNKQDVFEAILAKAGDDKIKRQDQKARTTGPVARAHAAEEKAAAPEARVVAAEQMAKADGKEATTEQPAAVWGAHHCNRPEGALVKGAKAMTVDEVLIQGAEQLMRAEFAEAKMTGHLALAMKVSEKQKNFAWQLVINGMSEDMRINNLKPDSKEACRMKSDAWKCGVRLLQAVTGDPNLYDEEYQKLARQEYNEMCAARS